MAVGPVHAGIIEPGHFRFQCHGETVFHLEISLGYQHRGVERALVGGPDQRTIHYAGDAGRRHDRSATRTAYCQAVEALAGCRAAGPRRRRCAASRWSWSGWPTTPATSARWPATSASCRPPPTAAGIRGDFLNLTALLCGSRFGRGLVRPGGVGFDLDDALARASCCERLERAVARRAGRRSSCSGTRRRCMARFEETGAVPARACAETLGLVGPGGARLRAASATSRRDHPVAASTASRRFPSRPGRHGRRLRPRLRALAGDPALRRASSASSSRRCPSGAGPRATSGRSRPDAAGRRRWSKAGAARSATSRSPTRAAASRATRSSIRRSTTGSALALALRGQQISDFPLCNKSFNLSYCGHDL